MYPRQLTLEEKQDPLNGTIFIVLKEVVPPELTWAAKRRINIFAARRTPVSPSLRVGIAASLHSHFALDSSPTWLAATGLV